MQPSPAVGDGWAPPPRGQLRPPPQRQRTCRPMRRHCASSAVCKDTGRSGSAAGVDPSMLIHGWLDPRAAPANRQGLDADVPASGNAGRSNAPRRWGSVHGEGCHAGVGMRWTGVYYYLVFLWQARRSLSCTRRYAGPWCERYDCTKPSLARRRPLVWALSVWSSCACATARYSSEQ